MNEIIKADDLQKNYVTTAQSYLKMRGADNPEFQKEFVKTFSDMIFSQNEEMMEKLAKTKQNSLLNAVFKATEAGASFAKRECHFIPFEIVKKETKNGVERKVGTGEYEALVLLDANFQKQQIHNLENCKRFFTAEIHEGVKIYEDLNTGNCIFEGQNDVTKPTIGYYAVFITTNDEKYDLFMPCAQIVERAKMSPHFKSDNYTKTTGNIHYEKIVIRNLLKDIPKISKEIRSILAVEESDYTSYEVVEESNQVNRLEEAKKEINDPIPTQSDSTPEKTEKEKTVKPPKNQAQSERSDAEKEASKTFDNTFF